MSGAMPGPFSLPPAVDQFDQAVDRAWDTIRGNPVADRVFYAASEMGDFGLIWNQANESGGVVVGHEVKVSLEIEAVQVS